jgi:hypothetical protein
VDFYGVGDVVAVARELNARPLRPVKNRRI